MRPWGVFLLRDRENGIRYDAGDMHPVNALLLGLLLAVAVKRRNGPDRLGAWRLVAGGAGALFAYSEIFLYFVSPGAAAQGYHGLTWSALLQPFYAFFLAGVVGGLCRQGWSAVFAPVIAGLSATWLLGAMTEEGMFPLAMLLDLRLALGVLARFDVILAGLCLLGLGMALFMPAYNRDLARLAAGCVLVYVVLCGWWAWEARSFGVHYAQAMELEDARVRVVPQALSPLNWRVIVIDGSGRLHDTLVTLRRVKDTERKVVYHPLDEAVWRIYRRYGPRELTDDEQRRVRRAWYAWMGTPFGWYGRYAVFDKFYSGNGAGCVGFRDLRYDNVPGTRGAYVICPGRGGVARVFRPVGEAQEGGWPRLRELVPIMTAASAR